jgi:hypothetical protein
MNKKTISEVMREMGRRGGKIGGKGRLKTMTPERRSEIAKTAAAASAKVRSKKAKERAALDKKPVPKAAAKKGNE